MEASKCIGGACRSVRHSSFAPQSAAAAQSDMQNAAYPGAVALSNISADTWVYKSFPQLLPLYVFKGEPPGQSLCDRPCTSVWPIVAAGQNDKPMGAWSIVKRDDGRLQWAYKNSPVYTYFEDRPNEPKGAGKNMDWVSGRAWTGLSRQRRGAIAAIDRCCARYESEAHRGDGAVAAALDEHPTAKREQRGPAAGTGRRESDRGKWALIPAQSGWTRSLQV